MTQYNILVFFHVASVIVWLGTGTAVTLITVYARRTRDVGILGRLGSIGAWLAPRVFAPASLATLGFGIAAAHSGGWPMLFWFHVGEAAFATSFLLNVGVRLPLVRRARSGKSNPLRVANMLFGLAIAELTVLYLAVADMVVKPNGDDTTALATGGVILTLGLLAGVALAVRSGGRAGALATFPTEGEKRRAA